MLRLALALMLLAAPIPATAEEFAGMGFDPPTAGWTRNPNSRPGIWQIQRRYERGTALIQVSSPIPAAQGSAEEVMQKLGASIPELAQERPQRGKGITVNGHRIAYEQRCCGRRNGASLGSDAVVVSNGEFHHILMLVTIGPGRDDRRAARAEFEAMVTSFRPRLTDSAFQLVPPPGAGGLEGVYTYLDTGIRPNAFGGTDFYAESEVTLFDPGGLFSRGLPTDGQDIAAYCREKPRDCGMYRLSGKNIEMLDASGQYGILDPESEPLSRDDGDLKIGSRSYRRVPPIPAGTRLQGVWRYFYGSSGSSAFSSGSVVVERILTLTPDGRFRRQGFAGASASNDSGSGTSGVTTSSRRPLESGRYAFDGYTLTLAGDDGREEKLSVFMADRGSDKLLIINGNNYIKRDGT